MFDYSIFDLRAEKAARQGSKGLQCDEEVAKATWASFGTFWATSGRERVAPLEVKRESISFAKKKRKGFLLDKRKKRLFKKRQKGNREALGRGSFLFFLCC